MGKIPVLGIVGYSGAGKTTLIEKLLPALRTRGLRVAVIKHDAHSLSFDKEGKDSWRFAQAGAAVTAVASGTQTVIMENRSMHPEELTGRIEGVDLILAEGFKTAPWPKLLVCRGEEGEALAIPLTECAAIVADGPAEFSELPRFRRDGVEALADFINSGRRQGWTVQEGGC